MAHVDLAGTLGAADSLLRLGFWARKPVVARIAADVEQANTADWLRVQDSRLYMSKKDVLAWARSRHANRGAMLMLMTLCADGYARQAAVQALARLGDPRSLLCLVPRTCDWVAQVGDAALEAVRALLAATKTEQLIDLVDGYHEWLRRRFRVAGHQCADLLEQELASERHAGLVAQMRSDAVVRRRIFATRVTLAEVLADDDLVVRGLRDDSVFVRLLVIDGLLAGAVDAQLRHADLVLREGTGRCLRRFLVGCDDSVVRGHSARITELAIGCVPGYRRSAQMALGRESQLQESCAEALQSMRAPAIAGVLLCIGECGFGKLASAVQSFLRHEDSTVVAAAIVSLSRLEDLEPKQVVDWLQSAHAPIRRAANWVLRRIERWRWAPAVRSVAKSSEPEVRLAAMRALIYNASQCSWEVVPDLLFVMAHEPSLRERAEARLDGWRSRNGAKGWLRPDAETKAWGRTILPELEQSEHCRGYAEWLRGWVAQ